MAQYSDSADKIDVRYVAHLARMALTDEEAAQFQGQLEQIIGYVDQLKEVDVEGIEPTSHAVPVQNVFRKDEPGPSLPREAVLRNAPRERSGHFVVPKILE